MGYDLYASNQALSTFHMGAFSWLHLLEQCGAYFDCIISGARWYALFDDNDPKEAYPRLISNSGFRISADEARVLARIARNYAAIQRGLKEPAEEATNSQEPFPRYIRRDWVELYEQFAAWSEQSHGFKIH